MIDKIGVELEGYWDDPPVELEHDGSLEFDDIEPSCNCEFECNCEIICNCENGCECEQICECDDICQCEICRCDDTCICDEDQKLCKCHEGCKCNKEICLCRENCICLDQCKCNKEICQCRLLLCNCAFECDCDICQCDHGCICENRCNCDDGCNCDGYCQCENGCQCADGTWNNHVGEIALSPHKDLEKLIEEIERHYPDQTNETCGFHVHLSFENHLDYMHLLSKEFYEYFERNMRKFATENYSDNHRFWDRLNGNNHFCQKGYNGDTQVLMSDKSPGRYYQLNFAFKVHGTLECRLFPSYKYSKNFEKVLRFYVKIVNEYLENFKKTKEKVINFSVEINEDNAICA